MLKPEGLLARQLHLQTKADEISEELHLKRPPAKQMVV
jgi:hypothetical protein